MHVAGLILLSFAKGGYYTLTLDLVPFNLVLTTLIMLKFHKTWNLSFLVFCSAAFLLGFGFEVLGIHTGFPFGNYKYGEVLGIKLFETPLLIGLNWLLVTYSIGCLLAHFPISFWSKILTGCIGLVFLDYFLEPVAMKHSFWSWENQFVPIRNYMGWFGVSALLLSLFFWGKWNKQNKVAAAVFPIQVLFFVLQNII